MTPEAERAVSAAIRDIPGSCTCTNWEYQPRRGRWVRRGRAVNSCPWHANWKGGTNGR